MACEFRNAPTGAEVLIESWFRDLESSSAPAALLTEVRSEGGGLRLGDTILPMGHPLGNTGLDCNYGGEGVSDFANDDTGWWE